MDTLRDLLQTLRIAARVLRKSPGFTAVAVLTLGFGMAASTTVFTWVDAVLLNPIPGVPDPGQLAVIEGRSPEGQPVQIAHPDFRDFQREMKLATGVVAWHFVPFTIGREEDTERVFGQIVSANFFAVLGVKPLIGRVFTPAEDRDASGEYPLAVISERLWHRRYHGDPEVLGKTARINGRQLTIIGVAPRSFHGTTGGLTFDVWVPLTQITQMGAINTWSGGDRLSKCFEVMVRLRPGVSAEQARGEVAAIGSRIASIYPGTHAGTSATLLPLWKASTGAQMLLRDPLRILMAVAILVLLIACANVANLLLARSVTRQREFGIRTAMGAGRGRLIGQLLAEASLLAGGGALFGIWASQWAGDALALLLPRTEIPITILFEGLRGSGSARVWIFSALVCGIATMLAGVVPVIYSGRVEVQDVLKEAGRSGMGGARSHRARGLLVVFEIALASVALIGAGLFTRSFENARAVNPGFNVNDVLVAHLYVGQAGYQAAREVEFDAQLRGRLERAPGVQAVAYADWVPLWFGESPWEGVRFDGDTQKPVAKINRMVVSPAYFALLGVPLLSGRDFTEQDDRGTPAPPAARGSKAAPVGRRAERVAIVNQEFARRYFGGRDPVGRKIEVSGTPTTVVGMVRNFKQGSAAEPPVPYMYRPFRQGFGTGHNNFVYIRSAGGAAIARGAVRQEMAALEPTTGLYDIMPMTDYAQGSLYQHRVAASLMGALGILSLLLAAVGLYSVMAYAVTERTQEIGIRMALGAQPGDVVGMVLRGGLIMTALGLAVGIAGALAIARLVAGLLFHVSPADPLTFVGAALFITAVAVLACWIPARRATRLDPLAALRCA